MTSVLKRESDEKSSRIRFSVCVYVSKYYVLSNGLFDDENDGNDGMIELRAEIVGPWKKLGAGLEASGGGGRQNREAETTRRLRAVGPFLHPLMETSLLRYWVELADRTINSLTISFN